MFTFHFLKLIGILFIYLFVSPVDCHTPFEESNKESNAIYVNISNSNGVNLKLTRPDGSVLHPNIKVIHLMDDNNEVDDSESGGGNKQKIMTWTPTKADLALAENLYVDKENLAVVRVAWDEDKQEHVAMSGVVNGNKVENGNIMWTEKQGNHSDYIDIGRKITPSIQIESEPTKAIVEVALICDMDFGKLFKYNRKRILDYFTVYFWDVNLRYKTLPSSDISFRITSIVIIKSKSGQPFIEKARAKDGRAEFGRILSRFADWVYGQMSKLPKFDISIAITDTKLEWGGGLAYFRTACAVDHTHKRNLGTLVFNDNGAWNSLTVGAHEIGHSVGAPHDDDKKFPGGCKYHGYIMSGGNEALKWFFSPCSDRVIGQFVRSKEASCLREINEKKPPVIPPDFATVLAPSMKEQCERNIKNPKAYIDEKDTANCKVMKCHLRDKNLVWTWNLTPADNTPCRGGGRCFRGRCRKIGKLLMNVGTKKCARSEYPFSHITILRMTNCPKPRRGAIPLDTFVEEDSHSNGKFLLTPYASKDGKDNGEKCVFTGNSEGDTLWTDRCNLKNAWQGWNMKAAGGKGEFLLQHRVTKRCAKPAGNYIKSYGKCNSKDKNMRWKFV